MIEKDDWRLTGNEDYLNGLKLKKIKFPDFWQQSFKEKNFFYKKVLEEAENYVKASNTGKEYLTEDKFQLFWHEHCTFCWEKFMTDLDIEGFCSDDYAIWICKNCFEDFKEKFNFTLTEN